MFRNRPPHSGRAVRALARMPAWIRDFAASARGNTTMLFAFSVIPLVGFVGAGVDYSAALGARTTLKGAADAAALAACRELQNTNSAAAARTKARTFFNSALNANEGMHARRRIQNPNASVAVNSQDGIIDMTVTASVKTFLLPVVGIKSVSIGAATQAICQGNAGNIEVAMMLDTTGSMGSRNKLRDLKLAAKDLIQIVIQSNQTRYKQRVALAPFAHAVNVGRTYFDRVTGGGPNNDPDGDGYINTPKCNDWLARYKSATSRKKRKKYKKKLDKNCRVQQTNYSPCVVERPGAAAFRDDAPGPGKYLGIYDVKRSTSANYYIRRYKYSCSPRQSIMPLTNDKVKLGRVIDSFTASGWTAGHLGTAWAWYLLSPKWSTVWPVGSKPDPYGTKDLTKIAILMTDGEYNTWYEAGNGDSFAQALKLCANMKTAGITVYTVGFALRNGRAINTLKACATTQKKHFFLANNGNELRQAFRTIGYQIAKLRLSK